MLHDPSHHPEPIVAQEIRVPQNDREILRDLAGVLAEVAAQSVHQDKARLWRSLNNLRSERPMVWINEICWNEMNVDDELTLRCEHPWARGQEDQFRKELYQWRHLPADMVVSDYLACPLAIHSTDFGIVEDVDVVKTDETSDVVSRHFKIQIKSPEDIEKIKMPHITHDEKATALRHEAMCGVYEGILPVRREGQGHIWFTPWDYLIRWWGIEEAMMDFVLRPEMVHAAVDRMVDAWMTELDQFVEQNLLALDNRNMRVGSGGYGYCDELPGDEFDPGHIKPHNMWGCSNAQIFSEVAAQMHWDFAVEHDLRWLHRWGLNYYGCCEPLHQKIDILRRIPNLRKVSVSAWCDLEMMVSEMGRDCVLSVKPNPAILAEDDWDPDQVRRTLREIIDISQGRAHVEIIMKDISTVRYQPQRLWEWAQIAMEEVTR